MTSLTTGLKGRAELGVSLLLGAAGVLVFLDANGLVTPYSQSDPVGPKTVPYIVAGLLVACAVLLAINVMRGGQGEAEGGEDVDLTHPADWKTILPLAGAFILNILLIDWAGWVISGTVLFWGSVLALGSRHYIRDGLISVALSLLTFYGFYLGLGIALPAGLLEGIL
ncbi:MULTISPECIES: tripartite tricarboxylate transporter TctB family protein [Micrococcaceae]|uniref:tripartite tricarboxylate transporter TctB family protein n=1 Tax=Micrococcaceae TaxID=1268 RepID=UPI00137D66A8|nr:MULTISPECIES: tripartite tricarboxylate transporter TctB family protein [Pseudarthrobacter]MEA3551859.1 tripartite tricarboxylate transporter TctB family protein [Pseudarthrobacter sp. C1]MUU71067.1 tripartite tricarboxylate transporter TctB family protein [Pseudarthrobacter sp. GA104]WPU09907.1 tripartite tricarboxylate transporter TctB family protein [Pseudarthrobacter oxydans]HET7783729.1 tripartite tricarboxylate transporter TctB family protein [Arthrobacter sp.]